MAGPPITEHPPSLQEIFGRYDASENPAREMLNLVLQSAGSPDPELPGVILACGVPRRFDPVIVGVLRDKGDETQRNRELFENVCALNFVLKREDGCFAYREDMREAVLEEWRSSTERKETFETINVRLSEFYEKEHETAEASESDLRRVESIMRSANTARYRKVTALLEQQLLLPLLEALYHRLLASPVEGFSYFRRQFHEQEGTGHLGICRSLISTTRDFLLRLPQDQQDPKQIAWLDYFDLRIQRAISTGELASVETQYQRLLARKGIDRLLRSWILNDLSIVQESQEDLKATERTRKELLALTEQSTEDVYNAQLCYSNLGELYWKLDKLEQAIHYYQASIETAERTDKARADLRVLDRLALCGVYCEVGLWEKAIEIGIDALCTARMELAGDVAVQSAVADRFMWLLASYDYRSMDSAAVESIALSGITEDSRLSAAGRYIDALDGCGRSSFAECKLQDLRREIDQSEGPHPFKAQLLFREALVCESRGRNEEAIGKYRELLSMDERWQVSNWTKSASLTNRGALQIAQGRWELAEEDLRTALMLSEQHGDESLTAYCQVRRADLFRRRGALSEAQEALDAAAKVLGSGVRPYAAYFHTIQAEVHFSQGRWNDASREFKMAEETCTARRERQLTARALRDLSRVAAEEGDWASAAQYSFRAAKSYEELSAQDGYRPSATDLEAARMNAEGMQRYCEVSDLDRVCELLRSALEIDPSNFWMRLNLAFTYARKEDWYDAAEAVEQALAKAPAPLRTHRLYCLWRDFLINHAENCFRRADYAKAIDVLSSALAVLEPLLPPPDLVYLRRRLGDCLLCGGRSDKARLVYALGAEQARVLKLGLEEIHFLVRSAYQDAMDGQLDAAVARIKSCLDWKGEEGGPSAREVLDEAAVLVRTPQQYDRIADLMRAMASSGSMSREPAAIVAEQIVGLADRQYREILFPLSRCKPPSEYSMLPIPNPIALEIDARMIPQEDTPGIRWMLESGFPEVRERFLREMGVPVPGVAIRSNAGNPPGGYFHQIFDAPLSLYTVFPERKFCPAMEKCREHGIEGQEGENCGPSGGQGLWLEESQWASVEQLGLPLWDPYQYMTYHTESVARDHLTLFYGVQELQNTLDNWVEGTTPFEAVPEDQKGARRSSLEALLPDDQSFLRLLRIMHMLLRENVPLLKLDRILAECVSARGDESAIVERIRLALREDLPGNKDGRTLIDFPIELEKAILDGVCRTGGTVFMGFSPELTQDLLTAARDLLSASSLATSAFVVSAPDARPLVRAVLALEFPGVPVLKRDELVWRKETV